MSRYLTVTTLALLLLVALGTSCMMAQAATQETRTVVFYKGQAGWIDLRRYFPKMNRGMTSTVTKTLSKCGDLYIVPEGAASPTTTLRPRNVGPYRGGTSQWGINANVAARKADLKNLVKKTTAVGSVAKKSTDHRLWFQPATSRVPPPNLTAAFGRIMNLNVSANAVAMAAIEANSAQAGKNEPRDLYAACEETFTVSLDDGDTSVVAIFKVSVVNRAPFVVSRNFRITPEAVRRNFELDVSDLDSQWVDPMAEIYRVVLWSIPDPKACTVYPPLASGDSQDVQQPYAAKGAVLSSSLIGTPLRVPLSVQFTAEGSAAQGNLPCVFDVMAVDWSGSVSRIPGRMTFQVMALRPPFVVNTTAAFRLGVDKTVNLELVGYGSNLVVSGAAPGGKAPMPGAGGRGVDRTNLTFTLLSGPSVEGRLFTVDDSEVGLGNQTVIIGKPIYTGTRQRVVVTFMPNEGAKLPVGKPDVLQYSVTNTAGLSATGTVTLSYVTAQSPACDVTNYAPVFWDQPIRNVLLPYKEVDRSRVNRVILVEAFSTRQSVAAIAVGSIPKAASPSNATIAPDAPLVVPPIGALYQVVRIGSYNNISYQRINVGDIITDADRSLMYMVRPENKRLVGLDTFRFRAITESRLSCHGEVNFYVISHDQRRAVAPGIGGVPAADGAATSVNVNVRYEMAKSDAFTLLPLWGRSNSSLLQYVKEKKMDWNSASIFAEVTSFDAMQDAGTKEKDASLSSAGMWYTVDTDRAPYDQGATYRGSVTQGAYCARYNCSDYAQQPALTTGSLIPFAKLWMNDDSTGSALEGESRVWAFFKAPKFPKQAASTTNSGNDAAAAALRNNHISGQCYGMQYRYVVLPPADSPPGTPSWKSDLQSVCVFLRPKEKRRIICEYSARSQRNLDLKTMQETEIPCNLVDPLLRRENGASDDEGAFSGTAAARVMVLPFDDERRHGHTLSFRMFQVERDGARRLRGARLDRVQSQEYNTQGMWVRASRNGESAVMVVPSLRSRSQLMTFTVRIYFNPANDLTAYEDVRVIVQRRNRLPVWESPYYNNETLTLVNPPVMTVRPRQESSFQISATDEDGDLLSFRVLSAPSMGVVTYDKMSMMTNVPQEVKKGTRIILPRGSSERSALRMHYTAAPMVLAVSGPDAGKLPVKRNDSMVIIADDGSGVASQPLRIVFAITPDSSSVLPPSDAATGSVLHTPSAVVAVMGVVTVIVLIVAVTVWLVRIRGKERYMHLPRQPPIGSHAGGTEMSIDNAPAPGVANI